MVIGSDSVLVLPHSKALLIRRTTFNVHADGVPYFAS